MSDHFQLDVDPEQLRAAARGLTRIAGHLHDSGRAARDTPGEIGDQWTGDAATKIMGEMTALGSQIVGFRTGFESSADALRSLAEDYEDAEKQVSELNQKWQDAQDAYEQAVQRADDAYAESMRPDPGGPPRNRTLQHEFQESRQHAHGVASQARATEQRNLEYSFGMMKQWLAQQTRAAGSSLAEAAPFEVTSDQVSEWSSRGAYPARFDRSAMWNTLKLAGEVEELALTEEGQEKASEDVERLNELLEQRPIEDPAELLRLLEEIGGNEDDPYYSEALVRELGPDGLNRIYDAIDDYHAMNAGEGWADPDEYWPSIKAFNDVVAQGLAQYNDPDLAKFVGEYGGPMGGPARLALILSSANADGRINGLGLAYLTRMDEQHYAPGDLRQDIAYDLLWKAFPDGPDEMGKQFADRTDTDALAALLNNVDEDTADWIADGLLSTGEIPDGDILHEDIWAAKQQVILDVLAQSMDENYPRAVEALFKQMERHNSYYSEDLFEEVAKVIDDPDRMMMLAQNATNMDAEVVARLADRVLDKIDVEDLLADITERGLERNMGSVRLARDLGYLLGLSDAADISIDYSGVWESVVGALAGASGKAAPVAGPVVSILTALLKANKEASEKYEDYGKNWSLEHQHEMLAWALYTQDQGIPPDYEEWVADNQNRIPSDSPDQAIVLYLQDISAAEDDSAEYEAWVEIEELMEQIGETRRIGGVD